MNLALAELQSPVSLDARAFTLFVVVATFLAGVHAFRKLSPYFAVAWFGSGLVFGWFWTAHRTAPEALLLPALVTYLAAALTKGLVEKGSFEGNHVVHVLVAGLCAGLLALPLEAACDAMGWVTPRDAADITGGVLDGPWFGGASADLAIQWGVLGLVFYGTYKLLDHIGIGPVVQTLALFGVMPFLPRGVEVVLGWFGGSGAPSGGLG
jgi:hypothetical protein